MYNELEHHKQYYQDNKERMKEQARVNYYKNRAVIRTRVTAKRNAWKIQGLCVRCGKASAKDGILSCIACSNNDKSPAKKLKQKEHHRQLKLEVFEAYGGKQCVCCGEYREAFLSIDHTNGGGTKHRAEVGDGTQMYYWMRRNNYPPGFTVMCHNCNHGRYLNGGICPHEQERTATQ